MMAQVIKQPDRYLTTPPDIMLIPKAYIDVIKNQYNPDVFDIVKIENGSDKKGIYNIFYGHLFHPGHTRTKQLLLLYNIGKSL